MGGLSYSLRINNFDFKRFTFNKIILTLGWTCWFLSPNTHFVLAFAFKCILEFTYQRLHSFFLFRLLNSFCYCPLSSIYKKVLTCCFCNGSSFLLIFFKIAIRIEFALPYFCCLSVRMTILQINLLCLMLLLYFCCHLHSKQIFDNNNLHLKSTIFQFS